MISSDMSSGSYVELAVLRLKLWKLAFRVFLLWFLPNYLQQALKPNFTLTSLTSTVPFLHLKTNALFLRFALQFFNLYALRALRAPVFAHLKTSALRSILNRRAAGGVFFSMLCSQYKKNIFSNRVSFFYPEGRTSELRPRLNRRAAGGIVFNVILRI